MKRLLMVSAVIMLLSGCATYKEKFKAGTVANIGFFSDSTVTMMSGLDLQQGRNEALLSRRFFDRSEMEEERVIELDNQFKATIENLMAYSIKIVNIAEVSGGEEEMVARYADYLSMFRDGMLESGLVDSSNFDKTLAEVKEQEKFLKALRKAQPLINAAAMSAIMNVSELMEAIDALALKVEGKIDTEYEDIARYRLVLEDERFDILNAFEMIYTAYKSDEPDLSALRESKVVWIPELVPEGRPTREDLSKIAEHLETRLNAMHRIRQEVDPDWQDYLDTQKELKLIAKRSKSMVQQTQILMLTWVRAHQKMASGKTDPAGWFDLGESTKALLKSAPGAIL
jgi:hypothetical protein